MTPGRIPTGAPASDYLLTLKRRKWWLIGMVVGLPIVALLLSLSQDSLYEAKAEVVVSRQNLAASLAGTPDTLAFQDATRYVETQARIAETPEVAARTIRALGLRGLTAGQLLANSDVSAEPNVDLLAFRVRDGSPSLARRLATEYGEQFSRYRTELDTSALSRALEDVRERIDAVQAQGGGDSPLMQSLVDKEQQLQTLESLQAANEFVVRAADPAEKVRPRPLLNAFIAGLIGVGLGLALVFLVEAVDTRVRSDEELVDRIGLPLLGRIPEPPRRLRANQGLVMLAEPESVEAEAFRMLRTNVDFANLDREAKTIMVTSAIGEEGKSTTIANLAVSYARAGRRVLLAELDLRRPNLAQMLHVRPVAGLVDVLLDQVSLDDAIVPIELEAPSPARNGRGLGQATLGFLAAGIAPPDVGELFSSKKLQHVLVELRERADIVLLDAPPLLLVGDAMALGAQADALLFVGRAKMLRRSMLKEIRRLLDAMPTEKLGVILTGSEAGPGYGYTGYGMTAPKERRFLPRRPTRAPRRAPEPRPR
jgi:capsular exopolysaccharide synthesis family protein